MSTTWRGRAASTCSILITAVDWRFARSPSICEGADCTSSVLASSGSMSSSSAMVAAAGSLSDSSSTTGSSGEVAPRSGSFMVGAPAAPARGVSWWPLVGPDFTGESGEVGVALWFASSR